MKTSHSDAMVVGVGNKTIVGIVLVPMIILLVPLVAMQFTREVKWDVGDFIVAWVLMAGMGFAYKLATNSASSIYFRLGVGLALATVFVLVWLNLAVGLIGSENNRANLMYFGVIGVAVAGAAVARCRPEGMYKVMLATAAAQALVPVIAMVIHRPPFNIGMVKVLVLNTCFVALFVGSGLLFRLAATQSREWQKRGGDCDR